MSNPFLKRKIYAQQETSYEWTEGVSGGENLNLGDDDYTSRSLPFTFTFYDVDFNNIWISSNGLVSFEYHYPYWYTDTFPTSYEEYQKIIQPFGNDWNPVTQGGVYVKEYSDRFVITWNDILEYGESGDPSTFQLVLFDDNTFRFNYKIIGSIHYRHIGVNDGDGISSTEYISNPTSEFSLEYLYGGERGDKVLLFKNQDMMWVETYDLGTQIGDQGYLVHSGQGNSFVKRALSDTNRVLIDITKTRLFNIDGQYYLRPKTEELKETGVYKYARFHYTRQDSSGYAHWGQAYHTLNYATGYALPGDIVYSEGTIWSAKGPNLNPMDVDHFADYITGNDLIIATNCYANAIETEFAAMCYSIYDHSHQDKPYIHLEAWRYWYWGEEWKYEEEKIGEAYWYPYDSQIIPEINNPLCGGGAPDTVLASVRWIGDIWHPYYDSKIRLTVTFSNAIAMKALWESWK